MNAIPNLKHEPARTAFCLSIAVPIYNEASVLPDLLRRTLAVLDQTPGGPHQLLLVDDRSSDQSLNILEQAALRDARIVVLCLSRNFGHQAALSAALDHAIGDAVVLMDGDLQDPPENIPLFIQRYQEGYDVAYATRATRKEGWLVRLTYAAFYRIQAMLSDTPLPLDAGDFGLMSRRVVDQVRSMPERQRYLRGLRSWVGFRQIAVPLNRAERHSGKSKYSLFKLLRLASDGIFAFSVVPLRIATLVGLLAVVTSVLYALYSIYAKFVMHRAPLGFTAIVFLVTFLSGTLLVSLGIVGEYVGRVYEEIKSRPVYIVERKIDFANSPKNENGTA